MAKQGLVKVFSSFSYQNRLQIVKEKSEQETHSRIIKLKTINQSEDVQDSKPKRGKRKSSSFDTDLN
jgi:hypothetical protein